MFSLKIGTNVSRDMVLKVEDDGPIVVQGCVFAMSQTYNNYKISHPLATILCVIKP